MNIEKNSLLDILFKVDLYIDRFNLPYNKKSSFFDRYTFLTNNIDIDKNFLDRKYLGSIDRAISWVDRFFGGV